MTTAIAFLHGLDPSRTLDRFDFLGYRFGPRTLELAEATIERFVEQATRLYEQERRTPHGAAWAVCLAEDEVSAERQNPRGGSDRDSLLSLMKRTLHMPRASPDYTSDTVDRALAGIRFDDISSIDLDSMMLSRH